MNFDILDCSQPLYFPTHAKEKASEANSKHVGVGAGRRTKRAVQFSRCSACAFNNRIKILHEKIEGCEQSIGISVLCMPKLKQIWFNLFSTCSMKRCFIYLITSVELAGMGPCSLKETGPIPCFMLTSEV